MNIIENARDPRDRRNQALEHAWYYVNLYTGEATWERPRKQAPGSPDIVPNTVICCEILDQVRLSTMTGRFSALSYCAGSAKNTTKIMVNGYSFNAFANLEHSLECIRHSSANGGEESFLIWTDQVCINQNDHEEKSHQVGFMRQIYEQAEQVYVVLSTTSTTWEFAEKASEGARYITEIQASNTKQFILKTNPSFIDLPMRDPAQVQLLEHFIACVEQRYTESDIENLLYLVQHLVSATWWTRAWVRNFRKRMWQDPSTNASFFRCIKNSLQQLGCISFMDIKPGYRGLKSVRGSSFSAIRSPFRWTDGSQDYAWRRGHGHNHHHHHRHPKKHQKSPVTERNECPSLVGCARQERLIQRR